jgi:hypothetical protein
VWLCVQFIDRAAWEHKLVLTDRAVYEQKLVPQFMLIPGELAAIAPGGP